MKNECTELKLYQSGGKQIRHYIKMKSVRENRCGKVLQEFGLYKSKKQGESGPWRQVTDFQPTNSNNFPKCRTNVLKKITIVQLEGPLPKVKNKT